MPEKELLEVLVIEDDADTRANLCDLLALDDYRVASAGSVKESLAHAPLNRFFAVILDRKLPDGDARDVLPRLRREAPEAAVLIVTGYRDLDGALACLREGAADYILKPINPDALRASLGNAAERYRLKRARERSESAFRHLVEAAECMIVMLRQNRTVCYFSSYALQLTGYALEEVMGVHFLERFLRDSDWAVCEARIDAAFAGEIVHGVEHVLRCKDGQELWILWNARRIDDYEGAPALLGVGHDITARKRADERALQAERLAAIGQMVAGLAHESRNALQRSKACLEMLAMEVEDRPEALDLVARVNRAQDHLHHLYEEVRSYAAPINLRLEPCRLDEVWRETWAALAVTRGEKQVALVERQDRTSPTVEADAFALGQVFRNILENAVVACEEPGQIVVATHAASFHGRPAITVSFRDNGPGLNREQREQIFEPFYTTKTKGTGLGMAIAKRIVDAHGGRIAVGTGDQKGAEILVTLPRSPHESPAAHRRRG